MDLVIIGNGFDIAHDLPCRYADFRKYLEATEDDGISFLEALFPERTGEKLLLWCDFEEAILYPDNAFLDDLLDGEEKEDIVIKAIQILFNKWIKEDVSYSQVEKLNPKHPFSKHLLKENIFLNFNYTDTLERVYSIYDVLHIHGQAKYRDEMTNVKLIFGHRRVESDVPFIEMTEKPTNDIISQNKRFFERIKEKVDGEIVVMGLSCSEVDCPYISTINKCLPNHHWLFYYYDEDDVKRIIECIKNSGIPSENFRLEKAS